MPLLAAALVAVLVWWLANSRAEGARRAGFARHLTLLAVGFLVMGLLLALRGAVVPAVVLVGAGSGLMLSQRASPRRRGDIMPPPPAQASMARDQALKVLGLTGDPAEAEIRAAHRRIIAQIYPDQGGSAYLAAQVNEARDLLLSFLNNASR